MTDRAIEMQPDEVRCMGVCVTDKKNGCYKTLSKP